MTDKEKAKAYDEALALAKRLISNNCTEVEKLCLKCVFPELKESEDERIRKWVISHFRECFNACVDNVEYQEFLNNKVIPWLERQKEQKPKEPDWCHHKVDLSGCSEEYMKAYYDGWNNCNQQHSQCKAEQKPAEWSDEDEQRIAEIEFAVMQMNTKRVDTKDKCLAWLKSLRPQQKVEWSEEDADMLNCCISSIEEAKENRYAYKETDGDTSYDREIDWLKSLSLNLKKKNEDVAKLCSNEWSEEDEGELQNAIDALEFLGKKGVYKSESGYDAALQAASWLKSLHPPVQTKTNDYITPHKKFFQWIYNRLVDVHGENPNVDYMQSFKKRIDNLQFDEPQWKPSEEQMDALRASNSYWRGASNETPCINLLESLHDDLEKLIAKR